jgi:nucleoid-associated protein YgaU
MIRTDLAKHILVATLTLGLAVGCATTEEPMEEETAAGPSPAAKNAIYSAKLANAKAAKLGYEWRDTGKLIQEAEKAAAAGDNDTAVSLAAKARAQAEAAIDQYYREQKRLDNLELEGHRLFGEGEGARMGMMDSYSVQRGDSLWSISGKSEIYGNPYQWPLIFKANADKIRDADLIFPGQTFDIDRGATGAEVDAAVRHAKTRGAWSLGEIEDSDRAFLAR